jgi:hypothetical protein
MKSLPDIFALQWAGGRWLAVARDHASTYGATLDRHAISEPGSDGHNGRVCVCDPLRHKPYRKKIYSLPSFTY